MTYQQLKWSILLLPTVIVGLWEYIRHEYLLMYISMDTGNWLTPVIIFLVTITLVYRLFIIYENMQEQLKKERTQKAILEERERIARDLHDDIAQSLFLCSVHTNRLKKRLPDPEWSDLDKSLRYIHDSVRDLIIQLKSSGNSTTTRWHSKWEDLIAQFQLHSGIQVQSNILFDEKRWSKKEKIHLYFCLQEALTNIMKHAKATKIQISCKQSSNGFRLSVVDNGKGFSKNEIDKEGCFGLSIMKERCKEIDARFQLERKQNSTHLIIERGS